MSRDVSLEGMRAMFAQETGEVPLVFLTLEHSSFSDGPIRVVYNTEPIVRTVGVFWPAPFEVTIPEETSERVPQLTLTMLNLESKIIDQIKSITGRIKVTIEVALASTPNVIEAGPFSMWAMTAAYDEQAINATLGYEDDILNTVFPAERYTPGNSPGMFS